MIKNQNRLLIRRKKPIVEDDEKKIKVAFEKHLRMVKGWLSDQSNIKVLSTNYNDLIENPLVNIKKINGFLGHILDESKMVDTVEEELYRTRIAHGYTRI